MAERKTGNKNIMRNNTEWKTDILNCYEIALPCGSDQFNKVLEK